MIEDQTSLIENVTAYESTNDNKISPSTDYQQLEVRDDSPQKLFKASQNSAQAEVLAASGPKKRKLDEPIETKSAKKVSPPWKKFDAEGPSSYKVGGQRVSARRNKLPLDLQPQGQTRGSSSRYLDDAQPNGDSMDSNGEPAHQSPHDTRYKGKRSISSVGGLGLKGAQPSLHTPRQNGVTKHPPRHASSFQHPSPQKSKSAPHRPRKYTRRKSSKWSPEERKSYIPASGSRPDKRAETLSTSANEHKRITKLPKLRLYYQPRPLSILNPLNIPRKTHNDLRDFLENEDPLGGEDEHKLTPEEAANEAVTRNRLIAEGRPGGILSQDNWSAIEVEPSDEPPPATTHPDHLIRDIVNLGPRVLREGQLHRHVAKKTALLAMDRYRRNQPRTSEEIVEDLKKDFKSVILQLRHAWDSALTVVKERKAVELQARKNADDQEEMKRLLEQSEGFLAGRVKRWFSETSEAGQLDGEVYQGSSDSGMSNDEDDELGVNDDQLSLDQLRQKYSNLPELNYSDVEMRGSNDEGEEDSDSDRGHRSGNSMDDGWDTTLPTLSQLGSNHEHRHDEFTGVDAEEFGNIEKDLDPAPSQEQPADQALQPVAINAFQADDRSQVFNECSPELEQVDDIMLDNSDEESDEDDEYDSDVSDPDLSSQADEDEEKASSSRTLGFLSKRELSYFGAQDVKNSATQDSESNEDPVDVDVVHTGNIRSVKDSEVLPLDRSETNGPGVGEINVIPSTSEEISRQPSSSTNASHAPPEFESASSVEPLETQSEPRLDVIADRARFRTKKPILLRGQLREYQHDGLDWLAGMYANGTNGILADEMGLGKTIQTIALLAHLAEEHHVWGPHLVVVPTSVILNWEMEFKKWCPGFKILTYYGNQEERRTKRKGWMDGNRWHVCITSYQLALQDASALKRKNWHFLVLDEAHNIKNFRSQRWQTLLGFKSQARLLLTGTPLQNNLTELWSLLFFLSPDTDHEDSANFGDLARFSRAFHRPVDQILEHGREALDDTARDIVTKLHRVLRPHLLRRLKAEVEKQMPKKYEHVTLCRLSKRQRQLYDSYMSLAGTRESFASGNYMSIINCLMQLRKVCNHPDLFETRQIVTSFAMPKSAIADYEIKELLVRRSCFYSAPRSDRRFLRLWRPNESTSNASRAKDLSATHHLRPTLEKAATPAGTTRCPDFSTVGSAIASIVADAREATNDEFCSNRDLNMWRTTRRPLYGENVLRLLSLALDRRFKPLRPSDRGSFTNEYLDKSCLLETMVLDLPQRAAALDTIIRKFGFATPAIVAPQMARLALTDKGMGIVRTAQSRSCHDPFHEARVRLSIAFPDKSLIQYDCGKLQRLERLLRQLQSGGHRALIFTQMTKVLNILERFLNLHGYRYLRLDGSTKIEERQVLTDRFNNDPRIPVFILSSRSGGLGINLTGADTVIFYDLDWNPAMDKQCQDRCHRIGQTRGVHIYRFVSEGTVEANILRKSNQKRMLDEVVIQQGDFTTEFFNQLDYPGQEGDSDTDAALDRVLGGNSDRMGRVLGQAEDKEDQEAARTAQKEDFQVDDADFADRSGSGTASNSKAENHIMTASAQPWPSADMPPTPLRPVPPTSETSAQQQTGEKRMTDHAIGIIAGLPQDRPLGRNAEGLEEREPGSWTDYLTRFLEWDLRDWTHAPRIENQNKKKKKKKAL